MKALFDDALFQSFAERALMLMTRGGAEYGECAATAARIGAGDVDAWHREWVATAAHVEGWGDESAARGHPVSAREAYLRATTYYRILFYPLFGAPVDPRLVAASDRETRCFDKFAALTEGADGHCEGWNRSRFDQQAFDWLDDILPAEG